MKIRITAAVFFIAFIFQGTILNLFSIYGITPNLILCLVIAYTFLYENEYGIYYGIFFGIISDICFSELIGVSSLGYLIVGYGIVKIRRFFNKENIFSPIIYGISGTIIYNLFYWIILNSIDKGIEFLAFLKIQPLYILTNSIVIVILYFILINKVVSHRSDRYYK